MGLGQSIRDFYYRLEDRYYAFLDTLEESGVSLYPIADAIESTGIPSFPVMILLGLLLLGIVLFFVFGAAGIDLFGPGTQEVSILVQSDSQVPLEGAEVTLLWANAEPVTKITRENGAVRVSVPSNQAIQLTIKKDEYDMHQSSFTSDPKNNEQRVILRRALSTFAREVLLKAADSGAVVTTELVRVRFSCSNADFTIEKTNDDGYFRLANIPENCGTLMATLLSAGELQTTHVDLSRAAPELVWRAPDTSFGNVRVVFTDADGVPVPGILARLFRISNGIATDSLLTGVSQVSGIAEIARVPTGAYVVTASDPTGEFEPYDGEAQGDTQNVRENTNIEFRVALAKTTAGRIRIEVRDGVTGLPIGFVRVIARAGQVQADATTTDPLGRAELAVSAGKSYAISVEHPEYASPEVITAQASDTPLVIVMPPASRQQGLLVRVEDSRGIAIPFTELTLQDPDNNPIGSTRVTGSDGTFRFTSVEEGKSYSVIASKKGLLTRVSEQITILPRADNRLVVVMDAAYGTVEFNVIDEQGDPVVDARLTALDAFSGASFNVFSTTDAKGKAFVQLRQDQISVFKVTASGFLPHFSTRIVPDPDAAIVHTIVMTQANDQLDVRLIGLYVNDQRLSESSVAAGGSYEARFALIVPGLSKTGSAGLFVRTGESVLNRSSDVGLDNVFIGRTDAAGSVLRGRTFTPPKGEAVDFGSVTADEAKWTQITWDGFGEGVYEARVTINVRGDASEGELAQLAYRGFTKNGGQFTRVPADAELRSSANSSQKNGLYANALEYWLTIGASGLCNGVFCRQYQIQDLQTQIAHTVTDRYSARVADRYKFLFSLSSESAQSDNASLVIESDGGLLDFSEYQILGPDGRTLSGNADATRLELDVGTVRRQSAIAGSVVFVPKDSGSTGIRVRLENPTSVDDDVLIDVESLNEMQLDVVPKEIVPLIDNKMVIQLRDANAPVSNAQLTVSVNDHAVFSGSTDRNGMAGLTLAKPPVGAIVKIHAEKRNYRPADLLIKVDNSVLWIIPPQISITLNAADFDKLTETKVVNRTSVPLALKGIRFGGEIEKYLELGVDNETEVANRILAPSEDQNVFLRLTLNDKALLFKEPRTLNGSVTYLAATVDAAQTGVQRFATVVPLTVHINLPGGLDKIDCISVVPDTWEFSTASSGRSIEVTITNTCRVNAHGVPLRNFGVLLKGGSADANVAGLHADTKGEIGQFKIVGSENEILSAQSLTLNEFGTLAPLLAADFEGKALIEFTPNPSYRAGKANLELVFKGTHATSKKEEHPQDALKTTAIVSNLAECVRVLAPPEVVVDASPFNLGYGQFGNYTGYNPMASNYYLSGGYNNPGANGFNGYSGLQGGYPGLGFSGGGFVGGSFVGGGLSTGYVGLNPNDPGRLTSTGVGNPNGYLPYSTPQTYPAPNYSTPFQTSYYDNAYNNQFQFDPGQSTIIVENACALPVDIRNEPTAGLLVLPPQLSLEPGERRNLQISPGYRLGRFSVTISARAKNSQDPFLEIAQVPVQVRRLGELLDECIQLSSREISLNNFLGKPVPKRIYNYCYDQGVRLLKSSRVIDFSCRVPGVLDEAANPNLEGSPLNADRRLQNASAPAPKGTFAVAQTKHASVAPIDGPIGPPALQPAQGSAAQFQNIFSNQYNPTGYSNAYPATQPAYYGGAATTSGFVGNYATQPGYNTYQSSVDQFGPIGTNPYGQQYFNNWPANGIDNGFYTPPGQGYNGYFPNDSYNAYGGATTSGYYGGYTGGPGYDGGYQGGYLSGAWRNADTYGQPYTDNQSQFAFGNEGQCPLIEDVYVIDEFVTGEGEAGTIQEIEFEIKPDIQYRKQFCRLKADLPFETVFNWRVTASGAYYRSNVDATANIHFLNQFGQWDTKYEHVKLKDTWGIGETIDACIANAEKETAHKRGAPGNCNAPLASCMEPNHLNLQQKYAANGGYVPQELFAGNTADLELVPEALRTGPQLCGEIDGITEVRPTIINHSSGVDVAFNRTQHNIAITIDRSQMKTACAKIEGSVEVLVNRPACFRGPQSATLPYKIWVLAPGKNATDAGVRDGNCVNAPVTPGRPDQNASVTPSPGTAFELQACGENNKGYSGENVRTALGLDKIVWNWDASKINENACSEKGSLENDKAKAIGQFCDAAQFALALDQKAAQLAPVIEKARERQALVTLAEKNAGQPAGAWDNSEQLWRYAYAQAVLPDATQQSDAKAKTLVFFQNADELASDSSAKIPPALARQLESQLRTFASPGGDETSKRVAFIKGLQAVLDKKEDWKSIEDRLLFRLNFDALEIPNDADGKTKTAYRETLSKGLDANTLTGQPGTYYWTLSEMRAFHKALSDTPACLSASASDCKIRIRNADVNVDANFIAKAYAAAVPFIGLPNNATTNENALRTAGATLADNLTQTEYDNARAQLDANVYLMKDGYNSADFKKDVVEKYTLKQFARDWNFTNTNNQTADIDRAGRHAMKLVFDWKGKTQSEKPAVRVQLARTHDLAQLDETLNTGQSDDKKKFHYANNPLFEMPFDGEVGGADRQGYATGFKTAVVENGFGGIKDKLRLKTGINLPKTTGSTTDANASSDANRPAQDSGPLVQPALTLGNKQFNSGTLLELAPNQLRFAPTLALSIRATLGASQQTGLVYAPNNLPDPLGANTRITPLVTWIDSEGKIERADALKTPTGFCDSKNENHSVFTGSSAKNLLGYLFAPAEEDESKAPKYGLNVICARGNATVGGVSIAESKPGVQTQITYAPFSRQELVSGTHITSLEKWLEQIDDARTCTYLTTDGFRTEWNRSNVLEAK